MAHVPGVVPGEKQDAFASRGQPCQTPLVGFRRRTALTGRPLDDRSTLARGHMWEGYDASDDRQQGPASRQHGDAAAGSGRVSHEARRGAGEAVGWALDAGYRHIDTASMYNNEATVGRAVRESDIPREEVFITTKLRNEDHGFERVVAALDESLERLDVGAVDLYLVHWPVEGLRLDTWRAMEQILASGKARAIGVSNYMVRHLEELFSHKATLPAVNQIELSPYNDRSRRAVVDVCREHGIQVEAYSPLTKAQKLRDPRLAQIADHYGKTPAQVLIRWSLQRGYVVIPKSTDRGRIRENAAVFDFHIVDRDMVTLEEFDEGLVTGWDPTRVP